MRYLVSLDVPAPRLRRLVHSGASYAPTRISISILHVFSKLKVICFSVLIFLLLRYKFETLILALLYDPLRGSYNTLSFRRHLFFLKLAKYEHSYNPISFKNRSVNRTDLSWAFALSMHLQSSRPHQRINVVFLSLSGTRPFSAKQ